MKSPALDQEAVALLQQAAAQMQAGTLEQAAALCQQVLERQRRQPDALHMLAQIALAGRHITRAEALFEQSLAAAPERPDILAGYGNFLRLQGRRAEARRPLRKAVTKAPDFAHGWHSLALLLLADGELAEAADCAMKLTELAPSNPAAWELAATVSQRRGDPEAAIQLCRQGLQCAPQAPRLHYSLGQLLRQECEFAEAAQSYTNAHQFGFDTPDLYRNHAEALLESGDMEAAMNCATTGVRRFPQHAVLQQTWARLHWELGAPGDPIAEIAAATRDNPGNPELWQTMGNLLKRLGRGDELGTMLLDARKSGCPETPGLVQLEALAQVEANPEAATATFRRLVETYPDYIPGKLDFADHLLKTGDPLRAETLCADAVAANPFDQLAWCYRGTAWQMLEDPREAWLLDYEQMVRPVLVPPPAGYGSTAEFFRELQEVLETLHRTEAHPLEQTLRGGTQTNGHLFRLKQPILRSLEAQILQAISALLPEFPKDPEHPFWGRPPAGSYGLKFAGAWSVRLRGEGFHTNHMHPEGWISSALYIALPDEVVEGGDNAGHIQFGVPLGIDLPPRRVIKPEVGSLVLFPSYMWHGTVPFSSRQPRMTVAFDLVPTTRPGTAL